MGKEVDKAKKKLADARKAYKQELKDINAEYTKKSESLRSKLTPKKSNVDKEYRKVMFKTSIGKVETKVKYANDKTLYRHDKKKRAIVYGVAAAAAATTAAVVIGISTREYDYKPNVIFNLSDKYNAVLKADENQKIVDFNYANRMDAGELIKKVSASLTNWSPNEKLVEIGNDPVKTSLAKTGDSFVYYFANTKAHTPTKAAPKPSLAQAFDQADDPAGDPKVGEPTGVEGEIQTKHLSPSDKDYKGVVPDDYDENGRYDNTAFSGEGNDFVKDGEYTHVVHVDGTTGKILSITDGNGNPISEKDVDALPNVSSKKEVDVMDDQGNMVPTFVTYAEAAAKMKQLVKDLGHVRGTTSTFSDFTAYTGSGVDIYETNIAGIFDLPEYINLNVDKAIGNTLSYSLSFNPQFFPELNETIAFDHNIVLYQQPGGAMKVLDDATKHFNANIATTTLSGVWNKEKLTATSAFKEVDFSNSGKGGINFDDFKLLTGLDEVSMKWNFWLKQLPSLKLEYRIVNSLEEDGKTQLEIRPKFKTYTSKIPLNPISLDVKGITQTIVDNEQKRINADKTIHDMIVDDVEFKAVSGKTFTQADQIAKDYDIQGLLDPKFTYKLSHTYTDKDGPIKLTIEVSKNNIEAKVPATPIDLHINGIEDAKALMAEQKYFNGLSLSVEYPAVEYPAVNKERLTQAQIDALGISHKLDLLKYEYFQTNTAATKSGSHDVTISVVPLSKHRIIQPATPFKVNFKGITEAQQIMAEQTKVNKIGSVSATVDKIALHEAKDAVLTQALADELGLGIKLDSKFTYTYSHRGINSDTPDLAVTVKVKVAGIKFEVPQTPITVNVTGINRRILIAGQEKEQEEINKLGAVEHDLKVNDIILAAKNGEVLKTDADFKALGIDHHVKIGYAYVLDSDELTADGTVDYKIKVMVIDPKTGGVDTSIAAPANIVPIKYNVTGINAAKELKAIQDGVNTLASKTIDVPLTVKDLINATPDSTGDVTFEAFDGTLTQFLADQLHLGITLNPAYAYHMKHDAAVKDKVIDVEVTVSKTGVANKATPSTATFKVNLEGIDRITAIVGLDREQKIINGLVPATHELSVSADSFAEAKDELLDPIKDKDLIDALGLTMKDGSFNYRVSHDGLDSDGIVHVSVTVETKPKNGPVEKPSLATEVIALSVSGIEDFELTEEQKLANKATATYEVSDLEVVDISNPTADPKLATATGVLTQALIDKYHILGSDGNPFEMKPEYKYTYSFGSINADGVKELTITVSGDSSFVPTGGSAKKLVSTEAPKGFPFQITGFIRAQAEQELAIEQERLNGLTGLSGGIIKAIKLPAGSGVLTDDVINNLFSEDDADKTKANDAEIVKLGLDTSKFTYAYTHQEMNKDGDLQLTIIAHKKLSTGEDVREIISPTAFALPITGINAATIQYITDIIVGDFKNRVVETSIDKVSIPEVLGTTNVEPSPEVLKELSLSFDKSTIDSLLNTMKSSGVDVSGITAALSSTGATVGLSTFITTQEAEAQKQTGKKLSFHYQLQSCDKDGNLLHSDLEEDGYMLFTLFYKVDGIHEQTKVAKIHIVGPTAENRRVALATEQTRINNLGPQTMSIAATQLDKIELTDKAELTQALIDKFNLKTPDGQKLVLDPTMVYTLSTDKTIEANGDINIQIQVRDRIDPTLEVHNEAKTVITATDTVESVGGINEERAIVTQSDAQNEINALSSGHYLYPVDLINLPAVTTPIVLATKDDFAKYGIDFDPQKTDAFSTTLQKDFNRGNYVYELTSGGIDQDGDIKLVISAMVIQGTKRTPPKITPTEITTGVVGIDAAKALKAEQEKINDEGKNGAGTFNVDAATYAAVKDAPLTQDIVNKFGLSMTLDVNYDYTYSLPTEATASGPMDMIINVISKTGKHQYGTAETFTIDITGIDEYKELQAAVADIQAEATKTTSKAIEAEVHKLALDTATDAEMTQAIADGYKLGITLDPSKFTYTYTIGPKLTADGDFTIVISVANAGPIKSNSKVAVTFNLHAIGITAANVVQTDLDNVPDSMEVTQPVTDSVTDGYNTNEYIQGQAITQDQMDRLVKDTLSKDNADSTTFLPQIASGATRTYEVSSKTATTLTITITDTNGDFTTSKDITFTGFVSGTNANDLDYPSEEITKDLAELAKTTTTTDATLAVSAHTDEPLTQKWNEYLGLNIVFDKRFTYTFSNTKTDKGEMDVTVVAHMTGESDTALDITQVFKVTVTEPPALDTTMYLESFEHAALNDAETLYGLPDFLVSYVGGITDQLRGYKATYTMPEIKHGENSEATLKITFTSIDEPTNTFDMNVFLNIGDPAAVTGEAKTLTDAGNAIPSAKVPTLIAEPTRHPDKVVQDIVTGLKTIAGTGTDAIINEEDFAKIPLDTPLTQALLDKLNIKAHVGAAIGLIGSEFTVETDTALNADGDIKLTIYPTSAAKLGGDSIEIPVHISGISDYKKMRADLDGLNNVYASESAQAGGWNTNEYTPWTYGLTEDYVERLTRREKFISDGSKLDFIAPVDPSSGITRTFTIKSKTATDLVIAVVDTINGQSVSRDIKINGFVAGTTVNDMDYPSEVLDKELTAEAAKDHSTVKTMGIPKVTDTALTDEMIAHMNLGITRKDGFTYTMTTDLVGVSGEVTIHVNVTTPFGYSKTFDFKTTIASGEIVDNDSQDHVFNSAPTVAVGDVDIANIREEALAAVDKQMGIIDVDVVSHTARITALHGQYFDLEITTENVMFPGVKQTATIHVMKSTQQIVNVNGLPTSQYILDAGDKITGEQFNGYVAEADRLKALPAGYTYEVTAKSEHFNPTTGAYKGAKDFVIKVMSGGTLIDEWTEHVTGLKEAYDGFTGMAGTYSYNGGTTTFLTSAAKTPTSQRIAMMPQLGAYQAAHKWNGAEDSNLVKNWEDKEIPYSRWQSHFLVGYRGDTSQVGAIFAGEDANPVSFDYSGQFSFNKQGGTTYSVFSKGDVGWQSGNSWAAARAKSHGASTMYTFDNTVRHVYDLVAGAGHYKFAGSTIAGPEHRNVDSKGDVLAFTHAAVLMHDPESFSYLKGWAKATTVDKYHSDFTIDGVKHSLGTAPSGATSIAMQGDTHLLSDVDNIDKVLNRFPLSLGFDSVAKSKAAGSITTPIDRIEKAELPELKDATIDQWLLDVMGIKGMPKEMTVTYDRPEVKADGPQDVTIHIDKDGVQTDEVLKVNFKGIDEYRTLGSYIDKLGTDYDAKPAAGVSWNTNEYTLWDKSLTPDAIERLTREEKYITDGSSLKFIELVDPSTGIKTVYTVTHKTGTSLTINIEYTMNGFSLSKDVTINGFVAGTSVNDMAYPSKKLETDLNALAAASHDTVNVMGIPKVTDQPLTDEMIKHMGLGIVKDPSFTYTFTTDSVAVAGEVTIHVKVTTDSGYEKVIDFQTHVKTVAIVDYGIQDQVFTAAPTVAVGSVDIANVSQDVLDVIKKQMGIADTDTTAATAEITTIHDQYYELKITMENTMFPGIKQDAIVNVQKGKPTVHVSGLATSRYILNAGDTISDQQFNAYVNEADRLKVLPAGYTYVVTAKSDHYNPTNNSNKGDKSFEIKIMKGSSEVDKWIVSISGLKEAYDGFAGMTGAYSYNGGTTTFLTSAAKTPTSQRIAMMPQLGAYQAAHKWDGAEDSTTVKNWADKEIPYSKWQTHFLMGYGNGSNAGAIMAGTDGPAVNFDYQGVFAFNYQGGSTLSVFSQGDSGWQSAGTWAAARAKSRGAGTMWTFDMISRGVFDGWKGAAHHKFAGNTAAGSVMRNVSGKGAATAMAHAAVLMKNPESFSYLKGWAHPSAVDKYHSDFTIDGVTHSMGSGPSTAADVAMTGTLAPSADLDTVTKVLERFPDNVVAPSPASPAPAADEPQYDQPDEVVIPQDDYPVDAPETSFFAWAIKHIYKGGE